MFSFLSLMLMEIQAAPLHWSGAALREK